MAVAVPAAIEAFLAAATPETWIDAAIERVPELLLDHANCELKAASTALGFLYRYPERDDLAQRMSCLAREELRHFEQVRKLMQEEGVRFQRLCASRYAGTLRDAVHTDEPQRLIDLLLVGALIEARSCERFARVAARLPNRLGRFYEGLLASEARHFEHYVGFARDIAPSDIAARLDDLLSLEAQLITEPDPQFRFHSGPPLDAETKRAQS